MSCLHIVVSHGSSMLCLFSPNPCSRLILCHLLRFAPSRMLQACSFSNVPQNPILPKFTCLACPSMCPAFQGNLSDLGKLLMQGSFSVWTDHKKGHTKVKELARFKPMQRHLFLHEKAVLFCKKREENGEGYEKAPSYSYKQSLNVSGSTSNLRDGTQSPNKPQSNTKGYGTPSSYPWKWALGLPPSLALAPLQISHQFPPLPNRMHNSAMHTDACPVSVSVPSDDGGRHHRECEG